MPNTSVPITAGAGTNVDTFTQSNGDHRQAMVLGDATDPQTAKVTVGGSLVTTRSLRTYAKPILVSTFRTLGSAATTQNIFALTNSNVSNVALAVRRCTVQLDATAALAAVTPTVKASRVGTGNVSGGTAFNGVQLDNNDNVAGGGTALAATASDGGAATAIVGTLGLIAWSQFVMRMHTLAGQVIMADQSVLPAYCEEDPFVLRPGEALLVAVVAAAGTSNPATNHWVVNCFYEQFPNTEE